MAYTFMRNACRNLVRKFEGKKPHERPRRRWDGVDWFNLAQDCDQ